MKPAFALFALAFFLDALPAGAEAPKTLNVLFIGNSFTARHNLAHLVEAMAEEGHPGLDMEVTTVIYGGRTLQDHWRLGTANFVKITTLTAEEQEKTLADLREAAKDPADAYAPRALERHKELLGSLGQPRRKWDVVVLQSYRDDSPDDTRYLEYAPKFAGLVKAQGGRVVLYETTPLTQNDKALTAPPDAAPVLAKERKIRELAERIGASVVPMAIVAHHCQTTRPDLTLRFVNDAHLNQTMAYLTACAFYGVLFDRSPEGLTQNQVTDTRYLDANHRDQDRDGGPLTRVFDEKARTSLQRIAWEGLQKFQALRSDGE
jgi:hypothetical protein